MANFSEPLPEGEDGQRPGGLEAAAAAAVLQAYFDALARFDAEGSALLAPPAVREHSERFAFHPVVAQLGGYVLDDADTSDHHVLVTRSPLAGSVLFLALDADTRTVFDSGAAFLAAVREARETDADVTDLHPAQSPIAKDQVALGAFVRALLASEELGDVVVCLVPSLDLADTDLLQRLVQDEDFFLGEAVANEITKRPSPALLPMAQLCAAHRHPQVARAGQRALQRVRQTG